MRNVAIINSCNELSTGKIALGLYNVLRAQDYNAYFYYGHGPDMADDHIIKMESMFEIKLHILFARLTGFQGSFSNMATTRLIADLKTVGSGSNSKRESVCIEPASYSSKNTRDVLH